MRLSETKLYKIHKFDKSRTLTTAELLETAGYIKQVHSGLYVQMPLMRRVLNNIEKVVRTQLEIFGALEIGLNQLQNADIWKQSERFSALGEEKFTMKDRSNNDILFTGTNEELVTVVAKSMVESYRDLPFNFYQINNKFRDEIRCNAGLIRCKEFIMMDSYSFHSSEEDLKKHYNKMRRCYSEIFDELKLEYRIVKADSGNIGGSMSEEFIVDTEEGEIEIGHIFQLGTKYSNKLQAQFVNEQNTSQDIVMGCYGIGITRLAQVIAEVNRIGNTLNWPMSAAPFDNAIIVADINDKEQMRCANAMYNSFLENGYPSYIDDRDIRIGQKLGESDLVGAYKKYLIGKNIKNNHYEEKIRSNQAWEKIDINTGQPYEERDYVK